jgi:mRNA interferase YafQ
VRAPSFTGQFKRDVKRAKKRGKDPAALQAVLEFLIDGEPLPPRYRDHTLGGNWVRHGECHIEPDWLLIYKLVDEGRGVRFERTGTHSDLFG